MTNPMLPHLATLTQVRNLALGIKLFRCKFNDAEVGKAFTYQPGQFGFLSAFGVGESPFGITSTTERLAGEVEFALAKVGTVTAALHDLQPGATVGVRGPYGNWFPLDEIKGKNIVIIGGGIGMAPLRPVIQTIADNRADFGPMTLMCAARQPNLLVFADEYEEWKAIPNTAVHVTVDQGDASWSGNVGPHHQAAGRGGALAEGRRGHHLRPADHDQVRAQEPEGAGLHAGADHHHAGRQDEVRHRQVRPLQRRREVRLHRRPGLPLRARSCSSSRSSSRASVSGCGVPRIERVRQVLEPAPQGGVGTWQTSSTRWTM